MAPPFRCLCILLTLWVVSSRPSATVRTGTARSSLWWDTGEANRLREKVQQYRDAGNLAAAEKVCQQGYELAMRNREYAAAGRYVNNVGGLRLAQLQYRGALDAFLKARKSAAAIEDRLELAAIGLNLSSLHLQMWDFDSAMIEAEQARVAIAPVLNAYCKPQILLQLGRLHEILADDLAEPFFTERD
jgi:hypothetical protein